MEDYTAISHYSFEIKPDKKTIDCLIEKLLTDNKIVDVNTDEGSISIEYYQQLTSEEQLQIIIENMGINLKHQEVGIDVQIEKNPYKRFLNRMSKSNEKNFGNKRLDCCDLHKKTD